MASGPRRAGLCRVCDHHDSSGRLTGVDALCSEDQPLGHRHSGGLVCLPVELALATLVPSWEVALLGYALVGIGCSNIVPVMYSLVGYTTWVMPENVAVPEAIITLGVTPASGWVSNHRVFVAHSTSLSLRSWASALLLCGVAGGGGLLLGTPPQNH